MKLSVVILAAGQGTRMRSALPKVLHRLGGRPLLAHVVDTACRLDPESIRVVYGHGGVQVREALADAPVEWIEQAQQLGTGHAVDQVMPSIHDDSVVLVLYGDVPLISADTLSPMIGQAGEGSLCVLTAKLDDPAGYGRIVRSANGRLVDIVEQKDASDEQLRIREINSGFLAVPAALLRGWLRRLDNSNAQGEYYLTDIVAMAVEDGVRVESATAVDTDEILGVNDRSQLAHLERVYQQRQARALMLSGVTLADPARFDQRGELSAGNDSFIDVNVVFEGRVELGARVRIGPNCVIRNAVLDDDVEVFANSVIDAARIGAGSLIGPFARIRPETELAERVHVGNFVEIKKSHIACGSKINHLSYIGDTRMGSGVNIGAGTITCNYDGANKHLTEIGDDVFVGSDTQLVAPVKVGDGATLGAGTTVTREVPAGKLTLSRCPQTTIEGWKRPVKKKS
jgi:bifunctional UDP-N-acetylglucosamine pyrophosphorylase/glucosamine-1-phosphate N-acetyltransferase